MSQLLRLPLATVFLAVLPTLSGASLNEHEIPQLSDERLQISLYAADPDIVTPIGGTVGPDGKFYVIECHTHSPPQNYTGPDRDLIKVFSGEKSDGTFESMSVIADDLFQAQALGFAPDGTLYVVCTREVLQLHDRDGDGHFESRTRILHLDPYEKRGNPHGQMMGLAFSNDGWLYTATGTTIDDWIDSTGKRIEVGPYWGGIIARCRPDGTQLERVAWGFWNPFSLIFDRRGRLLTVDNDPDHRAPNRLLHIVQCGDYGYKKRYGRYGLHPYQAWEGELPGTLPMIAGIGEAPTAVLNSNAAALPADYQDTIIGAVWGEHNLTLFRTEPEGASLRATSEILVQGRGHDDLVSPFRPSGLAASPVDGSIYVSDWMLIDYTTHKKGRIWKISAKPGIETEPPRQPFERQEPTPELARMRALAETRGSENYPALLEAATDEDPFIRNAALNAATQPEFRDFVVRDLNHSNAKIRLASLLALRRADMANPEIHIQPKLLDPDQSVARMAMQWAGEKELRFLTEAIDEAASKPGMDESFFQTWLATMQILQNPIVFTPDDGIPAYRRQRKIHPGFIEQLARDPNRPTILRALSLRLLQNLESPANHRLLQESALDPDSELSVEAIRRLADSSHPESQSILLQLAQNQARDPSIRTEAIAALAGKPHPSLASLLDDPEPAIQLVAARSLRGLRGTSSVVEKMLHKLSDIQKGSEGSRLRSQLEFLADSEKSVRPSTLEGWQHLLETGGDPEAGRRVFFSQQLACITCHTAEGRGHKLGVGYGAGFMALPLGPDLSHIGAAASRDVLIHSIVRPSDTIAPEYQGWFVNLKDGSSHTGREIDQANDAVQLVMLDGNERDYPIEEIDTWGAMEHSLMPDGLPQSMSIEEFRDLIAYLEHLK
jgi:putative membrane-bound dehydrogenase-like protein